MTWDIAVIGGGINGCGIARDAAGRGLSVYLCEKGDLGGGTSSASTKLIHGGLRYLENLDFRLVREALSEREILMHIAPHLVRPLRFILPHDAGQRPAWMLRAGLWLYDRLGGHTSLPRSREVDLARDTVGALRHQFRRGFEYSDCTVDDSRLVILNAVDAAERGASINPRTICTSAERVNGVWRLTMQRVDRGEAAEVRARVVINAAGPWVNHVGRSVLDSDGVRPIRLVKGSHIVVRRKRQDDRAWLFQNSDRRVVFAIPYLDRFTLIGTTEEDCETPEAGMISEAETDYLLSAVNIFFREPVTRDCIVWSYSGVRVLPEQPRTESRRLSREYRLDVNRPKCAAPLLTIYGGKITTYRRLAEAALARLSFPNATGPWTAAAPLPGGDISDVRLLVSECRQKYPSAEPQNVARLVSAYGSRAGGILAAAATGSEYQCGLTGTELDYLMDKEWARSVDDVLWRRSKLGLFATAQDRAKIAEHLERRAPAEAASARLQPGSNQD